MHHNKFVPPMSALGQKQTYALQQGMSALPPIADICSAHADVRFGPIADISQVSFDDLVGAAKHCRGHHKAERLGGLKIDHQFVLSWRLHRKVSGLLALEDVIDIAGRLPVLVDPIRSVGDQAAASDEVTVAVDRGQFVPSGKRDDLVPMKYSTRARRHDQTAIRSARERGDSALDFASLAYVNRPQLHPERRRHGLDCGKLPDPGGCGWIPKDRHSRQAWRDLLEQFQPFPAQAVFEGNETGGVAAGADWIEDGREYNRQGAGRL